MSLLAIMVAAAAGQAAAAPAAAPQGTLSLVDCGFQTIDFEKMTPTGESRRLVMLFARRAGRGRPIDTASVRMFDPSNLLGGRGVNEAAYRNNGRMLTMETASEGGNFFRFAIAPSPRSPGRWWGGLSLNGEASAEESMAQSYMGECTVEEPADAAARFDALRNEQ
jgi:hypothetical protein